MIRSPTAKSQRTSRPAAPERVTDRQFDDDATLFGRDRDDAIGDRRFAEERRTLATQGDGQVLIAGEVDEAKDEHDPLARRQIIETRSQAARALPAEVIEPVVAVRCDAQLAEPAEGQRCGGGDIERAEELIIGGR